MSLIVTEPDMMVLKASSSWKQWPHLRDIEMERCLARRTSSELDAGSSTFSRSRTSEILEGWILSGGYGRQYIGRGADVTGWCEAV